MLNFKIYSATSDAEWIVFIHGIGGSLKTWFKQVSPFSQKYNLLLLDLRGHGGSRSQKGPTPHYTLKLICDDIIEVLDHLCISKAHFVGLSLGTMLIRGLIDIVPARIKSVCLSGPILKFGLRFDALMFLARLLKRPMPHQRFYELFSWIVMPSKAHEFSRKIFIREAQRIPREEFLRWFDFTRDLMVAIKNFECKKVKIPSLFIIGSGDRMFLKPALQIRAAWKKSRFHIIPGAGHACSIDAALEFNKILQDFIQEHASARPNLQIS